MGDNAPACVVFYDVPNNDVPGIIEWLNDHGMSEDWHGAPPTEWLTLGETYGDDQAPVGLLYDAADDLVRVAPGSTFRMWMDAKYEFNAETLSAHRGEQSMSEGDQDGNRVVLANAILAALDAGQDIRPMLTDATVEAVDAARVALNGNERSVRGFRADDVPDHTVGIEARCRMCGETFNPADTDDLEHGFSAETDAECGGIGTITGWWM